MEIKVELLDSGRTFGAPLTELLNIIAKIRSVPDISEEIIIDLSSCKFSNPFLLGGLVVVQQAYAQRGYTIGFKEHYHNNGFASYMANIFFPKCVDPVSFRDGEYEMFLKTYQKKNFIPLTIFPNTQNPGDVERRDRFISEITKLIIDRCRLEGNIRQAIRYLISEALDNIVEHSQSEFSIIFIQFYPKFGHLDLIISDSGIGLLGSYKTRTDLYPNIFTHTEALKKAMDGKSTKEGRETRGFGLRTSRNMLVNGLNGTYFIMSGDAMYVHHNGKVRMGTTTQALFEGVLVALRIPINAPEGFTYTDYLE